MQITHVYSKKRTDIIWSLVAILSSKSFTILIDISNLCRFFLEVKIQYIQKIYCKYRMCNTCWNCFNSPFISHPPTPAQSQYDQRTALVLITYWTIFLIFLANGKYRMVCFTSIEVTTFLQRPGWQFDLFIKLYLLNHATILPSYQKNCQ